MDKKQAKSLTSGGIYYLIYNVLNMAFPLITGIYVARVLLPADIGLVSAAQNLAQYFIIFSFLGIPTYGLREISKTRNDERERSKVFSELFIINLISTGIFVMLYLILIFCIPEYRQNIVLYLTVGASIALNVFNISWLYEGMEDFRFISIRNLVFKILCFSLLVVFVKDADDYVIYAAITVIGTAGNYIINTLCSHRYIKFTFKGLNFHRHIKSIIFLVAVNLAIEIYSLVDVTMMSFMCSKESIAFYKYGHNVQKVLLQVVNTFTMVLIPRISFYFKERNINEFNMLLSKTLKIIIIISVPMIVGIYFTADFLIVALYGSNYVVSARLLKWFSLLLLISPIGYLLGSRVLLVTGNENKMIFAVGTGAVINVIGNSFLIPFHAEYGATIASIISEVVVMVVYVNLGKRFFNLTGIFKTFIKVLLSVVAMGVYLYILKAFFNNGWILLVVQIIGGVAIYGISLFIMNEEVVKAYAMSLIRRLKVHGK